MISAGNQLDQTPATTQPGMPAPTVVWPSLIPTRTGPTNTTTTTLTGKIPEKSMGTYMWAQAGMSVLQSLGGMLTDYWNHDIATKIVAAQQTIMDRYYKAVETVEGYKKDVAYRYADVQDHAIEKQGELLSATLNAELEGKRIDSNTATRIKQIEGNTVVRLKEMQAIQSAFSRSEYPYGLVS